MKRDCAGCIVPSVSGADFFVNIASRFRMHRACGPHGGGAPVYACACAET